MLLVTLRIEIIHSNQMKYIKIYKKEIRISVRDEAFCNEASKRPQFGWLFAHKFEEKSI